MAVPPNGPAGRTEEGWVLESDVWAAPPWEDQRSIKTRGGLLGRLALGFLGAFWASGRAGSGPGFPGASRGTPGPLQSPQPAGSVGRHSWLLSSPAGTFHGGFSQQPRLLLRPCMLGGATGSPKAKCSFRGMTGSRLYELMSKGQQGPQKRH